MTTSCIYIRWTLTHTDISISFKDSPYSVNENDGSVEVCVLLSVSSTQTVTLELESSEGTATAGQSNLITSFFPISIVLSGYHGYRDCINVVVLSSLHCLSICIVLSGYHGYRDRITIVNTTGSDYNASSIPATLTFPPGSTEQCIDVKVVDDDIDEPSETFTITVRRQGGVGGAETTQVTIEDGDG